MTVGGGPSPEADEALATLCQTYRYPLYGFLRSPATLLTMRPI
jgi:hypothetical protein